MTRLLITCVVLLVLSAPVRAQVIWAVEDGIRVMRDDTAHWSRYDFDANTVWDGTTVSLRGAKNEIVAFQLILSGGEDGESDLDVHLDTLSRSGELIRNTSSDPTQYVGRNIELFVEHYLHVTSYTPTMMRAGSEPGDSVYLGWIPDALVPIEATGGEKSNGQGGAPFAVAAHNIQGVWCDIYVPKTVTAGIYTGNIRILQSDVIIQSIPISLTVNNFTLPDSCHFKNTFFGSWGNICAHGIDYQAGDGTYASDWVDMTRKYKQMMHRHRMNLSHVMRYENFAGGNGCTQFYGQFLTGAGYTNDSGYAGPGEGVGDNLYPIGQYMMPGNPAAASFAPNTESGWHAAADNWQTWFAANAPHCIPFVYGPDEPIDGGTLPETQQEMRWLRSNAGEGRKLRMGVTVRMSLDSQGYPELEDSLDIFIESGPCGDWFGYNLANGWYPNDNLGVTVEDTRVVVDSDRGTRMVGVYNDQRPDYGSIPSIYTPQTDARTTLWMHYKYKTDLYLLWETAYWAIPRYPGNSDTLINPWYDPSAQGAGWIYSGEDAEFTGDDRGIAGPIASIRMKMYRRGMQDYEYLWMAEHNKGFNSDSLASILVPAAFNDNSHWEIYNTSERAGDGVLRVYPVCEEANNPYEAALDVLAGILEEPYSSRISRRAILIRRPQSPE